MERLKRVTELIANIAIICISAILLWTFIAHKQFFRVGSRAQDSRPSSAHLAIGDVIPPIPAHRWDDHQQTLLLAIRQGCKFCEASLPFYQQLSDFAREGKLRPYIIAVMPDSERSGRYLLASAGVSVDSVYNESLDKVDVSATPTLLLIDSSGHIINSWVGMLDPSGQQQVLASITK